MIISRDLKRTLTLKKVATVTMVIEHSPHSVRGSAGITAVFITIGHHVRNTHTGGPSDLGMPKLPRVHRNHHKGP